MITVTDLTKQFGKVQAVQGVSFAAPDGRITGLLGPNGAGKSTTCECWRRSYALTRAMH